MTTGGVYQSTTHGKPNVEVTHARAKQLITPEDIEKVLSGHATCCDTGNCIQLWRRDLGDDIARAVVTTERNAFAQMGETARRVHYMTWLQHLRVPQYSTTSGNKKLLRGKDAETLPKAVYVHAMMVTLAVVAAPSL
jgi:hypothetical protein